VLVSSSEEAAGGEAAEDTIELSFFTNLEHQGWWWREPIRTSWRDAERNPVIAGGGTTAVGIFCDVGFVALAVRCGSDERYRDAERRWWGCAGGRG